MSPSDKPSRRRGAGRRLLRWSAWTLGGLLLLPVLLLGFLETGLGKRTLAGLIEDLGSSPGQEIEIGTLGGSLFDLLTLDRVSLRDGQGEWMTLTGVTLDWSPGALLSGRLVVTLLEAREVAVERLPPPAAETAAEDAPFALPRMPFDLEVERLVVARVTLGAAVLGTPAALRLEASTQLDAAGLRSALTLERQDGTPGRIALTGDWRPAADSLALELSVTEPRGGLLARLLAIEGLPAIDLSLTGAGPLSDWQGRLDLALDGQRVAELTLGIDGRERRRLALRGRVAPTPLLPDDAQPWLAGGATLDGAATLSAGLLTIERLRLNAAAADLAVSGTVATVARTAELAVTATLLDPALLAPYMPEATLGGASVALTLKGPLAAPALAAEVTLAAPATLEAAAERVTLTLAGTPLGPDALERAGYRIRLSGALATPRLTLPDLPAWPWGDVALDGTVTLTPALRLGIEQLTVTGRDLALTAKGPLDLDSVSGTLAVTLDGRLPALPGMTEVPLGLVLEGQATLAAEGALATRFDASVTGAEALPDGLGALLGPAVALSGALDLAANGDLVMNQVALRAAGASVTLDGRYGAAGVDLAWQASVADLAALEPFGVIAGGAAALQGTLAGASLRDMTLLAALQGEGVSYETVALGDLAAEIAAAGLPDAPVGSVTLDAPATAYGPLALRADITPQQDGTVRLEPLTLHWGEALALEGRLVAPPQGLPLTGTLAGTLAPSPLLEQLGIPLQGSGTLAIELAASEGRQDAAVKIGLAPGRLAGIAHGGGRLNARALDLLGSPTLEATATFAGIEADPARLSTLTVTARGPLERLAVTLATEGELEGRLALSLAGELTQPSGGPRLALAPFAGTVADLPLALAEPAVLRLDGGALRIEGARFVLGEGSVSLDAVLGGGTPRLDLVVAGLDVKTFAPFYDETVPQGRIDLTLALTGSGRAARGTLTLEGTGLALRRRGLAVGPSVEIAAQGRLAEGRLALDAQMSGDFGRDLTLALAMPLLVALERYEVAVPSSGALSAQAGWQGQAETLVDFLPFDNQVLKGPLALDLRVTGTVGQPSVSGGLTLSGGQYENLLSGTLLRDLTLQATGQGGTIAVQASATDGLQGRLALAGQVDLGASDGLDADLRLTLTNFALMQRDDLFASVEGELALADRGQGLELVGSVTGQRIEYDIGASLPPSVATLDVVVLRDGQPVEPPRPEPPEGEKSGAVAPFALPLDLTVELPRRVFVRGSGLESEWAGRLAIRGTTAAPVITGSLVPQRGLFNLLGSEFALAGGAVTFDGGPDLDPRLDLRAVYEGSSIVATVAVGGRASRPEISLSSQPSLPQEEILARVLFGRGTGQISPLEAVQLAEAAAILSGATRSNRTVVDRLRQSFGLDVLRLEGGESDSDVSATLGQYLAPGLFLGLTGGSTPGSSGVTVEYEVSPEIVVEGKVGETSKVGVRWQWDY
jgi:translocation and assembly module TamB